MLETLVRPCAPHPLQRGAGALATAAWLRARGHRALPAPWRATVVLTAADSATRLRLILSEAEWGFEFRHRGKTSSIRVTDVPTVCEHDDFRLIGHVPPLRDVDLLVRTLEARHGIQLGTAAVAIESTMPELEPAIHAWLATWA